MLREHVLSTSATGMPFVLDAHWLVLEQQFVASRLHPRVVGGITSVCERVEMGKDKTYEMKKFPPSHP